MVLSPPSTTPRGLPLSSQTHTQKVLKTRNYFLPKTSEKPRKTDLPGVRCVCVCVGGGLSSFPAAARTLAVRDAGGVRRPRLCHSNQSAEDGQATGRTHVPERLAWPACTDTQTLGARVRERHPRGERSLFGEAPQPPSLGSWPRPPKHPHQCPAPPVLPACVLGVRGPPASSQVTFCLLQK